MLFLLTGEVQTGKTRWLESLVRELGARGVPCSGVLAPGVWVAEGDEGFSPEHADANGFEKLGINNVLLPQGECIPFAMRGDLARLSCSFRPTSQSARAQLAWEISDTAIAQVNAHFDKLAEEVAKVEARREVVGAAAGANAGPSTGEAGGIATGRGAGLATGATLEGATSTDARARAETEAEAEAKAKTKTGSAATFPGARGLLVVDELGRLEVWRGEGLTSAVALLKAGPSAAFPHALVVVRDYLLDDAENMLAPAWGRAVRISANERSRAAIINAFCGRGAAGV